jgi:hypothetical protein
MDRLEHNLLSRWLRSGLRSRLSRLLLCLPLCLIVAPDCRLYTSFAEPPPKEVKDDGAALPDEAGLVRLARTDPVGFLDACLRRYSRSVKGYECKLRKQERLEGNLQLPELMLVRFREEPFSVFLEWEKGERLARRVLFVKGENNDKLLVKPAGVLAVAGIVERDPEGPDARKSGRYPLTEFGIRIGTLRTRESWAEARKEGSLKVEYLGEKRIKELDDRLCYVLKRTGYRKAEADGFTETEATLYFDKETWLQVGSVLKGDKGELLGEYLFRDIKLNPEFKPEDFKREGLKR